MTGWEKVVLENDDLRVVVLPDKGAEIHELRDLRLDLNVLFEAPWGLPPPGGDEFLELYGGGWQELFPSVSEQCAYRGRAIPFHGEVALVAWEHEPAGDGLLLRCRTAEFRLERLMRLEGASLQLEETVVNESAGPAHFVWGHHCVVGPPFLEPGCRLHTPARTIVTPGEPWEDTARLAPGQREPWPAALLRNGGRADLREVPGPEAGSHDDVFLTDLEAGWAAVENPRLGLAFRLDWDPGLFRWIVCWQPYGGALAPPLAGAYALGIEPWTTMLNLEAAVAAGAAVELSPGGSLATVVRASLVR